ncbi:MAG: hypothetical protein JWP01_571 [Myxococcales bacterium]|nr:hypothetical protein [Myxococcales bacterium]
MTCYAEDVRWSFSILMVLGSCGPSTNSKPSGTASDPVLTCERVADVCRLDGARLGVCVHAKAGGFACQSQH